MSGKREAPLLRTPDLEDAPEEREGNYLEGRPGVTRTALRGGGA